MVRHLPRSFCVCGAVGVLVSEFFHIRVQSRSGDPHKVTDFFHGMAACPVQVHCVCSLAWIEAFAAAAFPPPGAGRLEAGLGAFSDERAFEFRQGAEDVEDQPSAA